MLFKKVLLINLSICLLVLFFFLNGNESNGKVRLFLPEKTWVMEVNIEGFKLEENLLSFDGESRRFFVSNENKNLFMSVFLEKAEGLWDSKDYREYYWNEYKRNTAKNKELPEPEEIRIWEEGEKAMLEYINKEFEGIKIIPSNEEEEELIFPVGESDWAEYKVENKLKAMDIKGMAGVAVRYNEDGSGYFIWVKPEERVEIEEELSKWDKKVFKKDKVKRTILKSCRLILEKRGGGKGEIIIERHFMLKRWWEVKIEVDVGYGRILVKVDGEPITEISDEIKSGKIALIAKPRHFSPFSGSYEGNLVIRREATEEEKGKESKELGYFISDWRWGLGGPSDYPLHYSYSEPDSEGAILYQTTTSLPPNEIVYYYHHDHLGNIRAVTDQNGNVVERHDFYPFGEEITQPTNKDSYLFTGKPRDSESGLDYFGARYYSSSLSRWLSADQITDLRRNIENPQRWNLYTYVLNNPLRNIDPDGLADVDVIIMVGLMAQFKEKACNYAVRRIAMDAFGISPKDNPDVWTILNTGSGTANEIYNKLEEDQNQGIKSVFLEVDEATAQELANEGNLVIAVQKNPFGSGHVAVVSPETIFTKTVADSTAFVKGGKGAKKRRRPNLKCRVRRGLKKLYSI